MNKEKRRNLNVAPNSAREYYCDYDETASESFHTENDGVEFEADLIRRNRKFIDNLASHYCKDQSYFTNEETRNA
jgi:hypothetical protein